MDKEQIEVIKLFDRRHNIIRHNNSCIVETVSFYEDFLFFSIIKPFFLKESYDKYGKIQKFMQDRMTLMDKFKIVKDIVKNDDLMSFNKFEDFIKMRNQVAHNIIYIGGYNIKTKEHEISIGRTESTWKEYLIELEKWAKLSYEMAEFANTVYNTINNNCVAIPFRYCKNEFNCILIQHNLISGLQKDEYQSFTYSGWSSNLIEYAKEEIELNKE